MVLSNTFQSSDLKWDYEVDLRALHCPIPILRAKKTLSGMRSGEILKICVTDVNALEDFQAFSDQTGNKLLYSSASSKGEFLLLIKRR